jgi:MoaA/NifB/PqqE/SkfB family radical SAM enzyme
MECNNLYIMLNRACTITCEVCCTQSGPDSVESLNFERLKKFIVSTTEDKSLKTITFTGGEPFLYYEELKKLISLAAGIGKKAVCITNGYWAEDFDIAYDKLLELKKAGLKELIISFDTYHNKYISMNTIRNLLKAARKTEIAYYLTTLITKENSLGDLINQLEEYLTDSSVKVTPCLPIGNAKDNLDEKEYIRSIKPESQFCHFTNKMLIKYDGTILPCTSPGILYSGLHIGNYEDMDYKEAKHRIEEDYVVNAIRKQGFDNLLDQSAEMGITIPNQIVSCCELCSLLFSKENAEYFYRQEKEEEKSLDAYVL